MGYVRQPWTINIAYMSMVKVIQNEFVLMSFYISLVKVGKEKFFMDVVGHFKIHVFVQPPPQIVLQLLPPFLLNTCYFYFPLTTSDF